MERGTQVKLGRTEYPLDIYHCNGGLSKGKKPLEVAIELGLREKQVNNFFREFWKLNKLNKLYETTITQKCCRHHC
jgi:hypothetical protein